MAENVIYENIENNESDTILVNDSLPQTSTKKRSSTTAFNVDTSLFKKTRLMDSDDSEVTSSGNASMKELDELGLAVYNQNELEQGILAQVDEAVTREEEARLKRIAEHEIKLVNDDIQAAEKEMEKLDDILASYTDKSKASSFHDRNRVRAIFSQMQNKQNQLKKLKAKLSKLEGKPVSDSSTECKAESGLPSTSSVLKPGHETETQKLIRLGEMTPFGSTVTLDGNSKEKFKDLKQRIVSSGRGTTDFENFLYEQDSLPHTLTKIKNKSSQHVKSTAEKAVTGKNSRNGENTKRDMLSGKKSVEDVMKAGVHSSLKKVSLSQKEPQKDHKKWTPDSDEEFLPEQSSSSEDESYISTASNASRSPRLIDKVIKGKSLFKDDGNAAYYEKRIKKYKFDLMSQQQGGDMDDTPDVEFDGGYRVTADQWAKLYRYQKTCVKWLWELHCQEAGGIVGDEMGLGKTIQLIVFLGGLRHSQLRNNSFPYTGLGPCLIVCPATVMSQWVREFHKWQPQFRVAILHSTGSYVTSESALIQNIIKCRGILITSYSGLVLHQVRLHKHRWHYVVLDEGHKIRNPDAQMTLSAKQFRTSHRIILSGSPIQNNLKELWSLVDFIFPGKLGTLPDFMQHFAVPITQGGYANATQVQVQTAYKCACVLRDTINPYLLRRLKADVKMSLQLPNKNEQVLFCRLTDEQREVYMQYLNSDECKAILSGRYKVFVGLMTLRKICNHPDISTGGPRVFVGDDIPDDDLTLHYGYHKRSGKMIVIESLLKIWKRQGHKVLLFSQSRAMLDILELFVKREDYTYMRMDGGTSIGSRQSLIYRFNQDPDIFVFLLTTRVGGIGVNLTGANRVVIYDPDWNPSTDIQARERSWRIGQNKQVTIYRLLTTGTIEEKIYHRQIFKQFLTNRVLLDPKQRRFFKSNDLMELFTLEDKAPNQKTETSAIFAGTGSNVTVPQKIEKPRDDKAARMNKIRELAKNLSSKIKHGKYEAGTDVSIDEELAKSHRKTKRRKKNAKLEGCEVANLSRQETYKKNEDDVNIAENKRQDDYVLQRLFAKTGVEEAVQHDVIINSSRSDYALVEDEAEKVARQAAIALKKSRAHCNPASSGIPTWTGSNKSGKMRFGQKKNTKMQVENKKSDVKFQKKADKQFDGRLAGSRELSNNASSTVSSSDLLNRMRQRNAMVTTEDTETDYADQLNVNDENYKLLTDIRDHIACRCSVDGQATTEEILDEFRPLLPPSDNAKFKAMLNQICTFEKDGDMGVWKLRDSFR